MRMLEILKDKKGSTMIEAAVIWPVVIVTLIFSVASIIYFSQCTIVQSQIHIALIKEEGKENNTRYADVKSKDYEFYKGFCHGKRNLYKDQTISLNYWPQMKGTVGGTIHVLDEKNTIRYKDVLDEIV